MDKSKECPVCGSQDMNLVDGFYYCVECGTQDADIQERIVEEVRNEAGGLVATSTRVIKKIETKKIEMSPEWYKWHAGNFIILGLTNDLIKLGANPTVKDKVLWIWARYVRKYQNKELLRLTREVNSDEEMQEVTQLEKPEEREEEDHLDSDEQEVYEAFRSRKNVGQHINIASPIKTVLFGIIYAALNLDNSDIQLSHLIGFMNNGQWNFQSLTRFVPKEIPRKYLTIYWINNVTCSYHKLLTVIMNLFRKLDLGAPLVPNMRNIFENFLLELCLPNDFKHLVFSLWNYLPAKIDFQDSIRKEYRNVNHIPHYECVAISYIIVALKLFFGVDGDYELKISEAVEQINSETDYSKQYVFSSSSEKSKRLFSFREWIAYLQYRRIATNMYFMPDSINTSWFFNDVLFVENIAKDKNEHSDLSEQITMDILKGLPHDPPDVVKPSELQPSLNPKIAKLAVILEKTRDSDMKERLAEDFTQYSLEYILNDLNLKSDDGTNLLVGVGFEKKVVTNTTFEPLGRVDFEKAFVRNCVNKNWFKTKRPKLEHVKDEIEDIEENDAENNDPNANDIEFSDSNFDAAEQTIEKFIDNGLITEEIEGKNIFDDDFENMDLKKAPEEDHRFQFEDYSMGDETNLLNNSVPNTDTQQTTQMGNDYFDSDSDTETGNRNREITVVNREEMIKELVLAACKKYRLAVPRGYAEKKPRQRRVVVPNDGENVARKRKRRDASSQCDVLAIISDYNKILQNDFERQLATEVRRAIEERRFIAEQFHSELPDVAGDVSTNGSVCNAPIAENEDTEIKKEEMLVDLDLNQSDNEENPLELLEKCDPDFDEKIHDTSQLYVKLRGEIGPDITEQMMAKDGKLAALIEKKIASIDEPNFRIDHVSSDEDSDDNIPLNILKQDRNFEERLEKQTSLRKQQKPLFNLDIKGYNYWMRQYQAPRKKGAQFGLIGYFEKELSENFPANYSVLMSECASMCYLRVNDLFSAVERLERALEQKSKAVYSRRCKREMKVRGYHNMDIV